MVKFSVNLNKIALIRNSRPGNFPNVTEFAELCIAAGADGITVHPRPDLRHIRPQDVYDLAELTSQHPHIEFNMEGNPFSPSNSEYPGFMALIREIKPDQCTLVPDTNDQLTSDHGFDLFTAADSLRPILEELKELKIRSSLFMDPDCSQIEQAKQVGAARIELYTGPYAASPDKLLANYHKAAKCAQELSLGLNAGHDLNLENLPEFIKIPALLEVSIGHAFTVDALKMGMEKAVEAYKACLN